MTSGSPVDWTLPWGKALRWEGVVQDRYRERKTEQLLKADRDAKREEVDQHVQDESGRQGRGGEADQGDNDFQYNTSFATLMDTDVTTTGVEDWMPTAGRPSFKRGQLCDACDMYFRFF